MSSHIYWYTFQVMGCLVPVNKSILTTQYKHIDIHRHGERDKEIGRSSFGSFTYF